MRTATIQKAADADVNHFPLGDGRKLKDGTAVISMDKIFGLSDKIDVTGISDIPATKWNVDLASRPDDENSENVRTLPNEDEARQVLAVGDTVPLMDGGRVVVAQVAADAAYTAEDGTAGTGVAAGQAATYGGSDADSEADAVEKRIIQPGGTNQFAGVVLVDAAQGQLTFVAQEGEVRAYSSAGTPGDFLFQDGTSLEVRTGVETTRAIYLEEVVTHSAGVTQGEARVKLR